MVRKAKVSKTEQKVIEFANSNTKLNYKSICARLIDQKLVDLSKEEIKQILKDKIPRFKNIQLGSDEKEKVSSSNRKRDHEASTGKGQELVEEEEEAPSNKKPKYGNKSSQKSRKISENSNKVQASEGDLVEEVEENEKEHENVIDGSDIEDIDGEPFTQPRDVMTSNHSGETRKSNVLSKVEEHQTDKNKKKKTTTTTTKKKNPNTPNSKLKGTSPFSSKDTVSEKKATAQKKKPPHEVPPPQPQILNSSFLVNNQQKKQIESFSFIEDGDPKKIRLFIDGISKVTAVTDKLHILHALYVSNGNAKTAIDLLCKVGMDKTLIWTPPEDALVLRDQKPYNKNKAEIEDRQKFLARVMQK